jgi:hypothetical protein
MHASAEILYHFIYIYGYIELYTQIHLKERERRRISLKTKQPPPKEAPGNQQSLN